MLKVTKKTFDGQNIEYETPSGVKYYDQNVEARALAKAQAKEMERIMNKQRAKEASHTNTSSGGYTAPSLPMTSRDKKHFLIMMFTLFGTITFIFVFGVTLWLLLANFWFLLGAIAIDTILLIVVAIKAMWG